jgi:hypothetical protein
VVAPRAEVIDENGRQKLTTITPERLDTKRSRPHLRLADVLRTVAWAPAQFGLIRTEALRKTRLIGPFYASDYVLLAELALLGEIWEVPEVLFQIRLHPGTSIKASKSWSALLSWFDPAQKSHNRLFSPHVRLALEFARSINRMPLPTWDRTLCHLSTLAVWHRRQCCQLAVKCRKKIGIRTRLKKAITKPFRGGSRSL